MDCTFSPLTDFTKLEAVVSDFYGPAAAPAQSVRFRRLLDGLTESFGPQTAAAVFTHEAPALTTWAVSFLGGVLALDFTLPMVFRFGVEKGRWGFMIIVFGVALLGGAAAGMVEELPSIPVPALALLFVAAVVATVVSIPLSIKLYQVN